MYVLCVAYGGESGGGAAVEGSESDKREAMRRRAESRVVFHGKLSFSQSVIMTGIST